nr:2-oxo acid dehydrogenase subunit E2 [Acetivibrio straminisolvens]
MQEIFVPQESVNDEFVRISKLYFKSGDYVNSGQAILEFETSKVNVCIDSEFDGYIEFFCKEGDELRVGELICRIYDSMPCTDSKDNYHIKNDTENHDEIETIYSKAALELIESSKINKAVFQGRDLVNVDDVKNVIKNTGHVKEDRNLQKEQIFDNDEIEYKTLSNIKRSEINNFLDAGNVTSTVYLYLDVKESYSPDNTNNYLLSVVVLEVFKLLKKYPELNAFFSGDGIAYYKSIKIGMAIDAGYGLKVVKLPDLEGKTVSEVENEIFRAIKKYLRNKLSIDDITGSTFTISDMSNEGVAFFSPLVSSKQSAVLGISGFDEKLRRYTVSLTFDHRVTEGRKATMFLKELIESINCYF